MYNLGFMILAGWDPGQLLTTWHGYCSKQVVMINIKVLDWIEGYVLTRVLIFGDFMGTVKRSDLMFDFDTASDYFRIYEGQRIQALSLPVKSRRLSTLLAEIESHFQRGWRLLDAGEWTEADFNQVFLLSREISNEIMALRQEYQAAMGEFESRHSSGDSQLTQ